MLLSMQMQGFGPDIPLLPDMRLRVEVSATARPKLQKVPKCGCYHIHTPFGHSGKHLKSGDDDGEPGIEHYNKFFKPFKFTSNQNLHKKFTQHQICRGPNLHKTKFTQTQFYTKATSTHERAH